MKKLYPDRFDADGNPQYKCYGTNGAAIYGDDNCATIVSDYVAANSTPVAPCKGTECTDTIRCFAGNDASGTVQSTDTLCDLVDLQYGY